MLSSSRIHGLEEEILRIYGEIEADLIASLSRKLATGYDLSINDWRLEKLSQMGSVRGSLETRLKTLTKDSSPKIEEAIIRAMSLADKADLAIIGSGSREVFERLTTYAIMNARKGINLSNSQAIEASMNAWVSSVNTAYIKTLTGGTSLEQSVAQAVRKMGSEGLVATYVSSNGRVTRQSLEVAVRRAVTTSVTQASTQMTIERCEEGDIDLVEVTAHDGSRPEHAVWQGKVYSLNGKTEGYELLAIATGYGEADGLAGVNCRHTFYPYVEGTKRQKDIGDTKEVYEQTQDQRYIERNIRKYKRQAQACEAAKDYQGAETAKGYISSWQGRMRDFVDSTGLTRQRAREQIQS